MKYLCTLKNKLTKIPKIVYLFIIVCIIGIVSFSIPTLARFEHRNPISLDTSWDGSVANSYRSGSGSLNDPYVISDGKELAYFANMLKTTNYANTYFKLGNNIVLNSGTFSYDETNGVTYLLNGVTYYVGEYENVLYTDVARQNKATETVQILSSLDNFAGVLDGNAYTIYGLYVTNKDSKAGLFTNLTGDINDLYVSNSVVYGGNITGGIASDATGSELKAVSYNGYVIGNKNILSNEEITTIAVDPITLSDTETTKTIDLSSTFTKNTALGNIKEVYLTGNLTVTDGNSTVSINNENVSAGNFKVNLDNSLKYTLPVVVDGTGTFNLTNLEIHINYEYSYTGGIIGQGTNISFKNVINKSNVYGSLYTGGLIGTVSDTISIADAYNVGDITSLKNASGIISLIQNNNRDVQIIRSYNAGGINGQENAGIVGEVVNNTGSLLITSVFDTSSASSKILKNINSNIRISGSYLTTGTTILEGTTNGTFSQTSLANLQKSTFLTAYWPFIDSDTLKRTPNRVWMFESGELPILYFDDLKNPIAEIHVGTNTWNNLGYVLDTFNYSNKTAFSINAISSLKPIKEIYYKISNSNEPLMYEDIENINDWTSYTEGNVVELTEEGFYVIYVKIIDTNNNTSYLNSDLIVIDLSNPTIKIKMDDNNWEDKSEDLEPVYIKSSKNITIEALDSLSGIQSINYYLSSEILTNEDLELLDSSKWLNYNDGVTIENPGKNILYVKAIDNVNHVTYANTDYIVLNGYNVTSVGSDYLDNEGANVYATTNSIVHANFSMIDEFEYFPESKHELIVNNLLPLNTKITLIDKLKNKVYVLNISDSANDYGYNNSCLDTSCEKYATIPFTDFKEIGTGNNDKYFDESSYTGNVNEEFTVIFDFSKTSNNQITNLKYYLQLQASDKTKTRMTLDSTIKTINLVNNANGSFNFTTNDVSAIYLNSDSITNINLNLNADYQINNGFTIWDSNLTNQKHGVEVWFTNESGEVINKNNLKTMTFAIGSELYYPEENGKIYIPLNSNSEVLTITTNAGSSTLNIGNYNIHIKGYQSYDGKYANKYSDFEKIIPLIVTENPIAFDYGLDIITNEENRILNKESNNATISFDILNTGNLTNPNISVSLYRKKELTAYNQDYELINLQDYATSTLDYKMSNTYYVARYAQTYDGTPNTYNHYDINLDLTKMPAGGYEFVFDLYDGTTKIGSVGKKYIVR